MRRALLPLMTTFGFAITAMAVGPRVAWADAELTVQSADQVLQEVMAIPGRAIPHALMAQARGVAIIPNVIKIGFVAGVRRGHGVVVVRDADGEWSLPQFVTLTGGSVGWQAGVQGSDVVLVFMTQQSVTGLMSGKFTIGADAAAAAGPVGRNAAAATDGRLQAEILSYSRSRGLFAGLAIDGSVIEVDDTSHMMYYGAPTAQVPLQIPASATRLRMDLLACSQGTLTPGVPPGAVPIESLPGGTLPPGAVPNTAMPNNAVLPGMTPVVGAGSRLAILQQSLKNNSLQLYALLDPTWQHYLALPREVFEGTQPPPLPGLQRSQQQFAQVAALPQYKSLAERPEFQATFETLQALTAELVAASQPKLALPPPPQG